MGMIGYSYRVDMAGRRSRSDLGDELALSITDVTPYFRDEGSCIMFCKDNDILDSNYTCELFKWIEDAVKAGGFESYSGIVEKLNDEIVSAMVRYEMRVGLDTSFREAHDALHALVRMAIATDPPVRVMRIRLRNLPASASIWFCRRGWECWAQVFPDLPRPIDLISWLQLATKRDLIEAILSFGREGGIAVTGRRRPNKPNSPARLEPTIMGTARGAAGSKELLFRNSGRPAAAHVDDLVMWLALGWLAATEERPPSGRSDKTAFGGLVHNVFGLLEIKGGATAPLRRYWDAVGQYVIVMVDPIQII